MFRNLFKNFSKDLGIDLGTANTLVYVKDQGIVINEPSVVAINNRNEKIIAIGEDAKIMLGKTPMHITVIRPLVDGVISDFEVSEKMIKHFIGKIHRESFTFMPRPRVLIAIPLDVTEVERKAVEDAVIGAGAAEVLLVEEALAGAIGAGLPIQEASGSMIVDIGGGTTEIAVISLGGVVSWKSLKLAGDKLNDAIIQYARDKFNIILGERTAERIKVQIASVTPLEESLEATMRGRDLLTGLPKEIKITDANIREAIIKPIKLIVDNIKTTIENTPPELVADLYERGMVLSGGGALLRGLDDLITQETKIPVYITDDPLTTVVRGTGKILDDIDNLKEILLPSTKDIGLG
ncbi:MAG: rod shape-determining protein [Candidatus Komeilibacteria bacterium CG11_big_fil_rev_8_21_14_0_20_36_20]|uniref:Cell shape-determining protein MreB n=1 Tax=Candidatus Komeilibacteria bacterium CG11_big_fil_rev_8_21_14_0_20_36_20 TaxID=1974477 RepID=A0A2H0NBP3_9BACT|nr:MAG: rod shape-determining protein [Candidatus Komeilibacteria bacterium CG11_big_fil_rev_8_21_14_0_20_36_20]PIR81461.1 MAG: rod shape-determining protein [Candidatus Komeilibacteria bacterium CG10_big_fil_rev_8_21_14_0_10_36_65]PJC55662.1 MAG: rod shape-determining protein [Candidatus Komeilibacteria bacterium CG_4_9_14_0_2_um_filter_36_13]